MIDEPKFGSMNLQECVRYRLVTEMLGAVKNAASTSFVVIIMDAPTLHLISTVLSLYELTEHGVTIIEKLEISRQPMLHLEAVYLISPIAQSIEQMLQDFPNESKRKYSAAHICFTSNPNQHSMEMIANSDMMRYIRTCKEVNMEFALHSSNVFDLELAGGYSYLYAEKNSMQERNMIETMACKLSQVCGCMHELPYIAYQSESRLAEQVALETHEYLNLLYRPLVNFRYTDSPATLLILDRSYDLALPLIHDVHYEAILYDLVPVKKGNYVNYANENTGQLREARLTEKDALWASHRYQLINAAAIEIPEELRIFQQENRHLLDVAENRVASVENMSRAVSSLPEYEEKLSQFTCHTNLISQLMKEVLSEPTQSAVLLEQLIITGVDDQANIKDAGLIVERVLKEAQSWPEVMRLRIVMLCAVCMDLGEKQRQSLFRLLAASDLRTVMNLRLLGGKLGSLNKKSTSLVDKGLSKRAQSLLKQTRLKYSYNVSRLTDFIQQVIENRLDQDAFRFVKGLPPSYQGMPPPTEAITNFRRKNIESKIPRVIVFVVGGLSYSEIHSISAINSQVVLGGSSLLNPQLYMQELMSISQRADHEEVKLDLR